MEKFIKQVTGFDLAHKHFISAEKNAKESSKRNNMYQNLKEMGYNVDLRDFKKKKVYCNN